jgi:hypothetical protein
MSIKIKQEIDTDPDLSYLGEFHRGNRKPFDMETYDGFWFTPGQHWPHKQENWKHVSQEEKEEVIKQYGSLKKADWTYAREDRQRLINYYKDKWYMIGIVVEATIEISDDGKTWGTTSRRESLWGIESDSGKDYKKEVIENMIDELKHELKEFGFTDEEIEKAIKEKENVNAQKRN